MSQDPEGQDPEASRPAKASGSRDKGLSRAGPSAGSIDQSALEVAKFGADITVYPDRRLPRLANGPVMAYAASGARFVMLCEKPVLPRTTVVPKYVAVANTGLARLVGSGPIYWPPDQGQRYVFVFEDNLGDPIAEGDETLALGWKANLILDTVLPPLAMAIMEMRNKDLAHGSIRPSNIYNGGSAELDKIVLGECLSVPYGLAQPKLFESAERAVADPLGRGAGTFHDDMYALGVTLAVLMRTEDPLEGLSEQEIIYRKLNQGSFSALVGKDRFSGGALELLRGLLHDDPNQRWTIDEVMACVDGRRLTPRKNTFSRSKAARPLHFNGESFLRPSMLAINFYKNPSEALRLAESGDLRRWIKRSVEDNTLDKRLEEAMEIRDFTRGNNYMDKVAARVAMALFPNGPIMYKGLSLFPDSFGVYLAYAWMNNQDLRPFVELIEEQMSAFWIDMLDEYGMDMTGVFNRFDEARSYLKQKGLGFGLERVLYYISPECPCLSEKLRKYYVRNPEDLLEAYDDMAQNGNNPVEFLDKHIIGFLAARDVKIIDPNFAELNAKEPFRYVLGTLKTVSLLQRRSEWKLYPGISRWMSVYISPLYDRFHDRDMRESLKNRVNEVKEKGNLYKIVEIMDDPELIKRDHEWFMQALFNYKHLSRDVKELKKRLETSDHYGRGTGREVAAVVSGVLSAIVILFVLFHHFY